MSCESDGQVRCDECGALDGSHDIKLQDGWTRKEPRPREYLHYCPACSKRKEAKG